jgi:DMSO/TMAO reductase YedYZ molybdopterin-dependent catalytic subunit
MSMKKILASLAGLLVLLSACSPRSAAPSVPAESSKPDMVSSATMQRYRPNELQEYNGTRLDPAVGPRDNSIKGIQKVDTASYTLTVDGLVRSPQTLTYDAVKALPAQTRLITIHCVEGWDATILWKGVLMEDLINAAKANPEAKTVIFHAVDDYTTSLPLHEILDKKLMLAYDANGLPLPPEMGYPFIFMAEDKWGYKWARWVNRIELSSETNYKGYWEKNGYDNEGDLTKSSR